MALTTVGDILLSIRSQIPDPVPGDDARLDGAFSSATLVRWIRDAARIICGSAPVLQDWEGFATVAGQDVYELPDVVTSVEQAWYQLLPMARAPEGDTIFTTRVEGRSWWFGPHGVHSRPRLHLYPAPSTTGASTTLASNVTATATSLPLTSVAGFLAYGFARLTNAAGASELVRYSKVGPSALEGVLRGQGTTDAVAWNAGDTVVCLNVFYKCSRLPRAIQGPEDPFELPQPLWPLVELYVLGKVREAEQDHQTSLNFFQTFWTMTNQLASAASVRGLRQGTQVRVGVAPDLFRGRVFIP